MRLFQFIDVHSMIEIIMYEVVSDLSVHSMISPVAQAVSAEPCRPTRSNSVSRPTFDPRWQGEGKTHPGLGFRV